MDKEKEIIPDIPGGFAQEQDVIPDIPGGFSNENKPVQQPVVQQTPIQSTPAQQQVVQDTPMSSTQTVNQDGTIQLNTGIRKNIPFGRIKNIAGLAARATFAPLRVADWVKNRDYYYNNAVKPAYETATKAYETATKWLWHKSGQALRAVLPKKALLPFLSEDWWFGTDEQNNRLKQLDEVARQTGYYDQNAVKNDFMKDKLSRRQTNAYAQMVGERENLLQDLNYIKGDRAGNSAEAILEVGPVALLPGGQFKGAGNIAGKLGYTSLRKLGTPKNLSMLGGKGSRYLTQHTLRGTQIGTELAAIKNAYETGAGIEHEPFSKELQDYIKMAVIAENTLPIAFKVVGKLGQGANIASDAVGNSWTNTARNLMNKETNPLQKGIGHVMNYIGDRTTDIGTGTKRFFTSDLNKVNVFGKKVNEKAELDDLIAKLGNEESFLSEVNPEIIKELRELPDDVASEVFDALVRGEDLYGNKLEPSNAMKSIYDIINADRIKKGKKPYNYDGTINEDYKFEDTTIIDDIISLRKSNVIDDAEFVKKLSEKGLDDLQILEIMEKNGLTKDLPVGNNKYEFVHSKDDPYDIEYDPTAQNFRTTEGEITIPQDYFAKMSEDLRAQGFTDEEILAYLEANNIKIDEASIDTNMKYEAIPEEPGNEKVFHNDTINPEMQNTTVTRNDSEVLAGKVNKPTEEPLQMQGATVDRNDTEALVGKINELNSRKTNTGNSRYDNWIAKNKQKHAEGSGSPIKNGTGINTHEQVQTPQNKPASRVNENNSVSSKRLYEIKQEIEQQLDRPYSEFKKEYGNSADVELQKLINAKERIDNEIAKSKREIKKPEPQDVGNYTYEKNWKPVKAEKPETNRRITKNGWIEVKKKDGTIFRYRKIEKNNVGKPYEKLDANGEYGYIPKAEGKVTKLKPGDAEGSHTSMRDLSMERPDKVETHTGGDKPSEYKGEVIDEVYNAGSHINEEVPLTNRYASDDAEFNKWFDKYEKADSETRIKMQKDKMTDFNSQEESIDFYNKFTEQVDRDAKIASRNASTPSVTEDDIMNFASNYKAADILPSATKQAKIAEREMSEKAALEHGTEIMKMFGYGKGVKGVNSSIARSVSKSKGKSADKTLTRLIKARLNNFKSKFALDKYVEQKIAELDKMGGNIAPRAKMLLKDAYKELSERRGYIKKNNSSLDSFDSTNAINTGNDGITRYTSVNHIGKEGKKFSNLGQMAKANSNLANAVKGYENVSVHFAEKGTDIKTGGYYDKGKIYINPNNKNIQETILHELQHLKDHEYIKTLPWNSRARKLWRSGARRNRERSNFYKEYENNIEEINNLIKQHKAKSYEDIKHLLSDRQYSIIKEYNRLLNRYKSARMEVRARDAGKGKQLENIRSNGKYGLDSRRSIEKGKRFTFKDGFKRRRYDSFSDGTGESGLLGSDGMVSDTSLPSRPSGVRGTSRNTQKSSSEQPIGLKGIKEKADSFDFDKAEHNKQYANNFLKNLKYEDINPVEDVVNKYNLATQEQILGRLEKTGTETYFAPTQKKLVESEAKFTFNDLKNSITETFTGEAPVQSGPKSKELFEHKMSNAEKKRTLQQQYVNTKLRKAKILGVDKVMEKVKNYSDTLPVENGKILPGYVGIKQGIMANTIATGRGKDFYKLLDRGDADEIMRTFVKEEHLVSPNKKMNPKELKKDSFFKEHPEEYEKYMETHNPDGTHKIDANLPINMIDKNNPEAMQAYRAAKHYIEVASKESDYTYQVPKNIYNTLTGLDKENFLTAYKQYGLTSGTVDKAFGALIDFRQNLFKRAVLGLSTGWNIGNRINNPILMYAHEKNLVSLVKHYCDAFKLKSSDLPLEMFDNNLFEANKFREVASNLTNDKTVDSYIGILSGQSVEKGYLKGLKGTVTRLGTLPRRLILKLGDFNMKVNSIFENFERKVVYAKELDNLLNKDLIKNVGENMIKQKLTLAEKNSIVLKDPKLRKYVIQRIEDTLGDFNTMTPVEKKVLKRTYTFYAWLRTINRSLYKLAEENPTKALMMFKTIHDIREDDIDRKEWQKGSIDVDHLIDTLHLPIKHPKLTRDGSKTLINPMRYLNYFDTHEEMTERPGSGLNPDFVNAYEAATGKSSFTGKTLNSKRYVSNSYWTPDGYKPRLYDTKTKKFLTDKDGNYTDKLPTSARLAKFGVGTVRLSIPEMNSSLVDIEKALSIGLNKRSKDTWKSQAGNALEIDKKYDDAFGGYNNDDIEGLYYTYKKNKMKAVKRYVASRYNKKGQLARHFTSLIQQEMPLNQEEQKIADKKRRERNERIEAWKNRHNKKK